MRLRRRRQTPPAPIVVVPLDSLERLLEDRLSDLGAKADDIAATIGDVAARFRAMAEQMSRRAGERIDECDP